MKDKLIKKINKRIEQDIERYGDCFTEITYDKFGMVTNIKFIEGSMHNKVIQEYE